jgi:signal transduction histidine kinase
LKQSQPLELPQPSEQIPLFKFSQLKRYNEAIFLYGLNIIIFIQAALVRSAYSATFLCIIIIIASIIKDGRFVFYLFFIDLIGILILSLFDIYTLNQIINPDTGLANVNNLTVLFPMLFLSFIIGEVIFQILIGTIQNQQTQYELLQKTQNSLLTQEKLASIQILAGGIAHDFNNLLTIILGNIELLKIDDSLSLDAKNLLNDAEEASLNSRKLTNQLLTFTQAGVPVKKPISSLSEFIQHTVTFSLRGRKSKAKFEIAPNLWFIEADPSQIGQVLQNLVLNADEAMEKGGIITVTASNLTLTTQQLLTLNLLSSPKTPPFPISPSSPIPSSLSSSSPSSSLTYDYSLHPPYILTPLIIPPGNYVKIAIQDTGIGIYPHILPKIFDPFFTTKPNGTGLGLSICYSIISKHQGTIQIESKPMNYWTTDHGSKFIIYLPAILNSPPSESLPVSLSLPQFKGRVLIMDDEISICRILSDMLHQLGMEAVATHNHHDTLLSFQSALQSSHPFDLVILDLIIPGDIGGIDTLNALLTLQPNQKAIIASGYSPELKKDLLFPSNLVSLLHKPYTIAELAQILSLLFSSSHS